MRLGQKFGAAALPLNDLDVHLKTFLSVFCLIVQPLPGSCQCGLLLHKFLCFGILPEGAFHGKFTQFFVGEKWDEKEVPLCGKPAIFGRLPHGKTNPKVQFPVQKVQNKC